MRLFYSAKWPSGKAEACKAFTPGSNPGFASRNYPGAPAPVLVLLTYADMAQLVEHNLAKVGVAGSSPVVRSKNSSPTTTVVGLFCINPMGSNPRKVFEKSSCAIRYFRAY